MGSTETDLLQAYTLCTREPWGTLVNSEGASYCDRHDFRNELSVHKVTLSAFSIDRTEVTVEQYDRCVGAGVCNPPGFRRGDARFDRPNFPVTMVGWSDAAGYCKWLGGDLPTEAQWEFAARGVEGRRFPWGNVYNAHIANHGSLADDPTDATDGYVWLAPVGSFPDGATPNGLMDMAGNVAEWVIDRVDVAGTSILPYPPGALIDPVFTSGIGRRFRGGSFLLGAHHMRTASRFFVLDVQRQDVGFRCVYGSVTPKEMNNSILSPPPKVP